MIQEPHKMSDKKKVILEYKESLLKRIRDCEKSIEEIRVKDSKRANDINIEDSSDSDSEQPRPRVGPTLSELQLDCNQLSVCLQATQELTSLQVLESDVNVLVEPPIEPDELHDVPASGTWREVNAECRLDLVPFSITFYVHEASGFCPTRRYRGVAVSCARAAHGAELAPALAKCATPSDAVQVISNYSKAARSRRSSLAALSRLHPDAIRMEALSEGGYQVSCAGVLRVEWSLINKGSRLAPFHHRLHFSLEPIDETSVKQICRLHKCLSEPTLETEERTLVLSKIIEICIEVGQSNVESSDTEMLNRSRTTVDQLPDVVTEHSRIEKSLVENDDDGGKTADVKQAELMAPPKQPPKKSAKRPIKDGGGETVAKKVKSMEEKKQSSAKDSGDGKVKSVQNKDGNKAKDVAKENRKEKVVAGVKKSSDSVKEAGTKVVKPVVNNDANIEKATKKIVSKDTNKEKGKNIIEAVKPNVKEAVIKVDKPVENKNANVEKVTKKDVPKDTNKEKGKNIIKAVKPNVKEAVIKVDKPVENKNANVEKVTKKDVPKDTNKENYKHNKINAAKPNLKETGPKDAKPIDNKDVNGEKSTKKTVSKDLNNENGQNIIKAVIPSEKLKKPIESRNEAKTDKIKKVSDVQKIIKNKPTKTPQEKMVQNANPKPTKTVVKPISVKTINNKPIEKVISGNKAPEITSKNNPKTENAKRKISSTNTETFKSKIPRSKLPLKVQNTGSTLFKKPEVKDSRFPIKFAENRHLAVRSSPRSLNAHSKPRSMFGF